MRKVNMLEAKTELSRLVGLLENGTEDVIYLARRGKPIVQMTRIPVQTQAQRIGIAAGQFEVPDAFDTWDKEIEDMFGGEM